MQLKPYISAEPLSLLRRILLLAVDYRIAKRVTDVMVFHEGNRIIGYYICPRCDITLDRECMAFCDRCGQRLDWTEYEHARVIYPGRR